MKNNKINIVLASDQNFVKLLVPCIISILYNKKPSTEIDIYILESGISNFDKQKIKQLENFNDITNCKIEFIDIKKEFSNFVLSNNLYGHTGATLYRLAIPKIFKHLERVLYLDTDIIVRSDLLELYNKNFEDNYCACVKFDIAKEYYEEELIFNNNTYKYKSILLKMGFPEHAFSQGSNFDINAGITLFNISKIIEDNKDNELLEICFKYKDMLIKVDQDIMIASFKDKIKNLDSKYNYYPITYDDYSNLNNTEKQNYLTNTKKAVIFHYLANPKPNVLRKLYKLLPIAYQEFYKYYQMSYLRINTVKLKLIFLLSNLKRFRRNISGTKITKEGKKVFYFLNLTITLKSNK